MRIDKEKLLKAYKPPFSCDNESAMVVDSEDNAVVVVRGWSRLCQIFNHDEAFKFQLNMAHFVTDQLNAFVSGQFDCVNADDDERSEDWERTEDDKMDNKDITF